MRLCFATNNRHKLHEVQQVIGSEFMLITLDDINCREELPETQNTLEGNALQKAEHVYRNYGVPCFADDTGLEVEGLNNAPGVYSARYAGEQKNSDNNIQLLLRNMEGLTNRKARFRTVIALVGLEEKPVLFEGAVNGSITKDRRGTSGFGYDPVFVPVGFEKTFAEMTLREKNQVSHRARAVEKLARYLQGRGG